MAPRDRHVLRVGPPCRRATRARNVTDSLARVGKLLID